VMYIGLGSCVSLCFTFGMVVNKFTAGGFLVTRVYNFDLAEQSSVNSQTSGWSDLAGMTRCKARLKLLSNFGAVLINNIFHLYAKPVSRLCP
jgi:hypothetical protein